MARVVDLSIYQILFERAEIGGRSFSKPDWWREAYCKKAHTKINFWFSEKKKDRLSAKYLCRNFCPVRGECLLANLDDTSDGIFGGCDSSERKKLRTALLIRNASVVEGLAIRTTG